MNPLCPYLPGYPHPSHKLGNPRSGGDPPSPHHFLVNTGSSVDLYGEDPLFINRHPQLLIILSSLGGRLADPLVGSAATHSKNLRHLRIGKYMCLVSHKLKDYPFVLPKMPIAFFRILRSMRSSTFSAKSR